MLELIRGIVRPASALIVLLATVGFIAFQTPLPSEWWPIVSAVVAFYFAARSAEKQR